MRVVCLIMVLLFSIPVYVTAQGRGHGRGLSKKSTKFVNGHDARDGRFDGRGPRPGVVRGPRVRPGVVRGPRVRSVRTKWHHNNGRHRGWVKAKPGKIR
jgi:hypothetical protein